MKKTESNADLKAFPVKNITSDLSLHDQEIAANVLVKKVINANKLLEINNSYALPDHLEQFRIEFEKAEKKKLNLPIISQISPRSKKQISLLPAPNRIVLDKIEKIEEFSKTLDPHKIYGDIHVNNEIEDNPDANNTRKVELIPKHAPKEVNHSATQYYETIEQIIKRKQEQREKMAKLFDKGAPTRKSDRTLLSQTAGISFSQVRHSNLAEFISNKVQTKSDKAKAPSQIGKPVLGSISTKEKSLPKVDSENIIKTADDVNLIEEYDPLLQDTANISKQAYERYTKERLKFLKNHEKMSNYSEKDYLNQFSVYLLEETGLDINKEYNRLRRKKDYLQVLLLFIHTQRTKAGFDWWKSQYKRARHAFLMRAAKRMYRFMRAAIHWKAEHERQKNLQIQLEEQRRIEREYLEKVNKAATRIQHSIRKYIRMKRIKFLVKIRKCSTVIQKLYRGHQGRKKFLAAYNTWLFLCRNARKIQTQYRRHLAKRKVTLKRKLKFVADWLEHVRQVKEKRREDFYYTGAELMIAKIYRTHIIRKKLKRLIYWNHYAKSITIQRVFRGYKVRKVFKVRLKAHRADKKLKRISAITIQKIARAMIARERVRKLDERREHEKVKKYMLKKQQLKGLMSNGLPRPKDPLTPLRKLLYYFKPFKHIKLNQKATIIQKIWRGHHGRVRAFMVKIRNIIDDYNKYYTTRMKSATNIQRRWRGYCWRREQRHKKMLNGILRIQCIWRLHKACRKVKALKKLNKDASRLTKLLFRLHKKHKFHIKWKYQQARMKYFIKIQAFWRKWLAIRRVRRFKHILRAKQELDEYLYTRTNDLLSSVQLRLIVDTSYRMLGYKYHTISKHDCPCHGPLQAIFVNAACAKGRTEQELLKTNRLDTGSLLKFAQRIPGLLTGSSTNTSSTVTDKTKLGKSKSKQNVKSKQQKKRAIAIIEEIDSGRLTLPQGKSKLSGNELDVMFGICRTDQSQGNVITYEEFFELLQLVADVFYFDKSGAGEQSGHYHMPKELVEEKIDPIANMYQMVEVKEDVDEPVKIEIQYDEYGEIIPTDMDNNGDLILRPKSAGKFTSNKLRYNVREYLGGNENHNGIYTGDGSEAIVPTNQLGKMDYRVALIFKIIFAYRHETWMKPIFDWLDVESKARVGVFVIKIQCMYRKFKSRRILRQKKQDLEDKFTNIHKAKCATKITSLVLMFLCRHRVARKAQSFIFQYLPYVGKPYWHNPRTEVKTFTKPKILRNLDSYSISLPEKGLENIVYCCYCNRVAEINCQECEDSMCKICYESMHCKGNRRLHHGDKIPKCSYCKFQVATISCLTCVLNPPKKGNIQETMTQSDRGIFCDTCFMHEHDSWERALEHNQERKEGLRTIMNRTREAYLIHQQIHQKIMTNHRYDHIVQPCEECHYRSSNWRCRECRQIYCNRCLVGLHSMGPFSKHTAELLPYYTSEMHVSFLRDFNAQIVHKKLEKLNRIAAIQREEHRYHCCVYIQAWWRMIYYGHLGRKQMKRQRRRLRIAYRARRKEDREIRDTFSYKVQSFLSRAPRLATDTTEEITLRTINVFQRQQAREYIWKNQDDWGYYRVSSSNPRKGIPHKGFEVGTYEELYDQAKYGGFRLPGRVMVQFGSNEFNTTTDLTNLIRPGELIRIKYRLFAVSSVKKDCIKVNRNWRELEESEEGELAYRVPTYKNEPERLYYRAKYISYDLTVGNFLGQLCIRAYVGYNKQMVRFSIYMLKVFKKSDDMAGAMEWKKSAEKYADNARWGNSYLNTSATVIDLSAIEMPTESADELKRKRKLAAAKKKHDSDSEQDEEGGDDGRYDGEFDDVPEVGSRRKPRSSKKKRTRSSKNKVYSSVDGEEQVDSSGEELQVDISRSRSASEEDIKRSQDDLDRSRSREDSRDNSFGATSRPTSAASGKKSGSRSSSKSKKIFSSKSSKKLLPEDELDDEEARKKLMSRKQSKKKRDAKARKAGEIWYANREETEARDERESKMTPQELADEAMEWKEEIDIMTENVYWVHIKTFEAMTSMPRAVAAKRQLDFENSKNKRNYDEAQKRIKKFELVTKNRMLITGGRKK